MWSWSFLQGPFNPSGNVRLAIAFLLGLARLVKAEDLFESFSIYPIALALVAGGGAYVNFLRHLIQPAGLIPARETDQGAALSELIEPRDFEGESQRIPTGQHVSNRTNFDPLSIVNDVLGEHRQAPHLDPFAVQVMLGETNRVEADFLT